MSAPTKSGQAIQLPTALSRMEETLPASSARLVLGTLCALVAVLLIWACVAQVDIVAVAEGRLVPQSYIKVVQSAHGGIVREIRVREGEHVKAGQVLVTLDPTTSAADRDAMTKESQLYELQLRRIDAELRGREFIAKSGDNTALLAQVRAQYESSKRYYADRLAQERAAATRAESELVGAQAMLQSLRETLPMYEKAAASHRELSRQRLVSALQAEERERELLEQRGRVESQQAQVNGLEAAVRQATERMAQLTSEYTNSLNQSRIDMTRELTRAQQQLTHATFVSAHLELSASQDAIVKDLATTTIGSVVNPGAVLMTLVPSDEPLRAEVQILNQDIGFVRKGQKVRVKLLPYAFQKYGVLEGTLINVSADARENDGNAEGAAPLSSFKALIELQQQFLATQANDLPISAGMQVTAEIIQGRRTIAEFLLSPVQRILDESARER